MRTTIDISDALLAQTRRLMKHRKTTLRSLVEEGLARVLEEGRAETYEMPDARFKGPLGYQPGVVASDVTAYLREFNEGRPVLFDDEPGKMERG